jgi:hypothetical protein
MQHPKSGRSWLMRPILIILAGLFVMPAGVWGVSVSLEPLSLRPGESGTTNLSIDSIPSGLSGYRTGLKLTTPGIAEFTDISFPSWAGLNDKSGFPGSEVSFRAADLGGSVERDAGRTILATLTVRGLTAGTTMVTISDLVIDDDADSKVTATVENSTVIVSPAGEGTSLVFEGGGNGGASASTSPASSPDTPVMTTLPTQVPETSQATGNPPSPEITSAEKTVQVTAPQTVPTQLPPEPTTPARGIPLLSLVGLVGLMVAILIAGTRKNER